MNNNILFTDEFNKKVMNRFNGVPKYDRPWTYNFVSAKDNEPYVTKREEIETFLKELDEENRNKFLKKLRKKVFEDGDDFLNTYHELGIGIQLMKQGFEIVYEKNIKGKTPDWFISNQKGDQEFIVDVYTSSLDYSTHRIHNMCDHLSEQLSHIPIGVDIEAEWKGNSSNDFPIKYSEFIQKSLHEWLNAKPPLGSISKIKGIHFKICEYWESKIVNCQIDYNPRENNENELDCMKNELNKISEKIDKYKKLGYPLIIVVVAHTHTFRTDFRFFELLEGNIAYNTKDKKLKVIKNQSFQHLGEALSAVLFTHSFGLNNWEFVVYRNPNAKVKVPESRFGKDFKF